LGRRNPVGRKAASHRNNPGHLLGVETQQCGIGRGFGEDEVFNLRIWIMDRVHPRKGLVVEEDRRTGGLEGKGIGTTIAREGGFGCRKLESVCEVECGHGYLWFFPGRLPGLFFIFLCILFAEGF